MCEHVYVSENESENEHVMERQRWREADGENERASYRIAASVGLDVVALDKAVPPRASNGRAVRRVVRLEDGLQRLRRLLHHASNQ